jgi:hypothetical protein
MTGNSNGMYFYWGGGSDKMSDITNYYGEIHTYE